MPNARQISDEQLDIYEDAPLEGNVLVTGPPGTGKTVIAFLRAEAVIKKRQQAIVLMFNRVLRRYTENVADNIEGNVVSKTLHSWLPDWWRALKIVKPQDEVKPVDKERLYFNVQFGDKGAFKSLGGRWDKRAKKWYVPIEKYESTPSVFEKWVKTPASEITQSSGDYIYLNSSFHERNEVREAGAKWNPSKKKWFITQDQLSADREKFEKWLDGTNAFDPPTIKKYVFDWEQMNELFFDADENNIEDWGHLIIDEAQDFPPAMYRFLRDVGRDLPQGGITILADENQRLYSGQNSSIDDIRKNLKVKADNEFKLTQNFRNTKQIAEFSNQFYVGLPSGKANLPSRSGSRPKLIHAADRDAQVKYICNFLQFRGAQEVAVIVDSERDMEFFMNALEAALPSYSIQHYSSKKPSLSEELIFDNEGQGVLTILNRKSCKGLEFDIVFLPELQNYNIDDDSETTFKMNMYVMCSRARTDLVLMMSQGHNAEAPIMAFLPPESSGLLEIQKLS
jgi:superfamily I DNA/RNA helicase